MIRNKLSYLLLFALVITNSIFSQAPKKPTASEIYHDIQKLNFLGSALYVGAHPDDENTSFISYLSNDVKARTAYLSLTRGDGGQNEVGTEIREFLGVIRTQELLAARRIDGGSQLFTRANDFGYSKHSDETLEIWTKEEVLSDVVRAIRKFKPDVIVNRFDHRTPGRTHGHHTASAMLSFEAFDLVGDATQYPETALQYGTWQPKRLFFNTNWWFYGSREKFEALDKTDFMNVNTGAFYPNLGLSNGEISALSRSRHKSQGFGSTGNRGNQVEYFELLKGDFPRKKQSLFEGVNTTWSRVKGGEAIGVILSEVEKNYDFKNPSASVPQLLQAYQLIQKLEDEHWKTIKLVQIKDVIAHCGGIYLEAVTDQQNVSPKGNVKVTAEAINRSGLSVKLNSMSSPVIGFPAQLVATELAPNKKVIMESTPFTFSPKTYSTPYYLDQKGSLGMYNVPNKNHIGMPELDMLFPVNFNLSIEGVEIVFTKNMVYKYNDPVKGEVYQPFDVLPDVTSSIPEKVWIFSDNEPKKIPVTITAGRENFLGTVSLLHPKGWKVTPAQHTFSLGAKGSSQTVDFMVIPPSVQGEGYIRPYIEVNDVKYDKELITIDYEHIPFQNVLMPSQAKVVRIPINIKGENIGYINGAGDVVPESIAHMGYNVTTIDPTDISDENLKKFDAIVIGIRAYNFVDELEFKQPILMNYVKNGGTLVVQYNKNRNLVTNNIAPYPLKLSRDRVTDEFSNIKVLAPNHPVMNQPNKLTPNDFKNWVQERGLYFPNEWSKEFTPILGMNDKNDSLKEGSLLVASYGDGHYVYTGLSFFRELPAGVSGAYRLFANILSLGN